jgi:soluble lytic murein transglycosylase
VADSEAVWRARYWRARLLEEVEPATSLALHAEVARQQPGSWYALLARTRLSTLAPDRLALLEAGSPPPQEAPVLEGTREGEVWPLPREGLAKDPHFLAGVELLRMGLPDAVGELLEADRRSLSEGGSRLLFQILQRTGYKRAAGVVARTSLQQSVSALPPSQARAIWEASWPRPFRPLIDRHSRRARVDPDLLQALIREESRFNPRARSSTGAIGLAQLMPATAREVARALRLPEVTTARLQQPADNIQLGAHYLGGLLRQFDGNLVHAVAGYNAGPAAVARWKRARPEAPLDEWVEHIPFEETRGYVKRVLGSYAAYKLLYAPESPLLLTAARR